MYHFFPLNAIEKTLGEIRGSRAVCSAAAASATTASAVSTTATTAVAGILSLHVAKGFARGIRRALTVAADHSGLDVINNRLACSSA